MTSAQRPARRRRLTWLMVIAAAMMSVQSTGADKPELRGEALLLAGELHEQAKSPDRALAVYLAYVQEFPKPVDLGVETRFKIADIYKGMHDERLYLEQLKQIVAIDAASGAENRCIDRRIFPGLR